MRKPLLAVIFVVLESAFAAERGIGSPITVDETKSNNTAGGSKWAVVIGVGTYDDPLLSELPLAVNDAKAVAQTLTSVPDGFPADNVILLATGESKDRAPTRANMKRFLKSYFDLAETNDTFLVYFAGHGITTAEDKLCLMTQDAAYADPAFTAFPFSELKAMLDACAAKRKILIMDACHAGKGRSDYVQSDAAIRQMQDAEGLVILSSCDAKERSFEMEDKGHGAFTYYLLEGLRGEADENKDGYVSASEMGEYTSYATSRWAANQGFTQRPLLTIPRMHGSILLARATPVGQPGPPPVMVSKTPAPAQPEEDRVAKDAASAARQSYELNASSTDAAKDEAIRRIVQQAEEAFTNKRFDLAKSHYEQASKTLADMVGRRKVSDSLDMVHIPGGSFTMGNNEGDVDERPAHQVSVSDFEISRYEVTALDYCKFLNAIGKKASGYIVMSSRSTIEQSGGYYSPKSGFENKPASIVTWYGAYQYCEWLTKTLGNGKTYRLPTEAEWEYAARGAEGRPYPWGSTLPSASIANFGKQSASSFAALWDVNTVTAGSTPGDAGILHMAGNVFEWCQDVYAKNYYEKEVDRDPMGPKAVGNTLYVLRGGSVESNSIEELRATARSQSYPVPTQDDPLCGFRVAAKN